MNNRFVIEDDLHAELMSKHSTFTEVLTELYRLSCIPWDQAPHKAPCTHQQSCGRKYEIVEYDISFQPWKELKRTRAFEINVDGILWNQDLKFLVFNEHSNKLKKLL